MTALSLKVSFHNQPPLIPTPENFFWGLPKRASSSLDTTKPPDAQAYGKSALTISSLLKVCDKT